ncbi:Putative regulator of cell autolysis [Aquiflexum balticum DSM 16537]|uniref:Putative regulator of cell autolysis n=1 Tax=Aquiflexum balticum DSM 16537 TaxID=758820 RepID=A0A1W2H6F0_9BACT|nr:histidine kinase [Aquiflexum balticum]SMD44493.1 Putative regulator of cell autolysis [Aquiflexum balticum DSM 16537]
MAKAVLLGIFLNGNKFYSTLAAFKILQIQSNSEIKTLILFALIPVMLAFTFVIFVFYRSKREAIIKEKETELLLQKTEVTLKALKAQINPHFIFNCLNSIHHYMYSHPVNEAGQYLLKFSQQIRYVLESSERKTVPLSDELEANRIYLELEQLRLNHTFDFSITVENGLDPDTIYIPPMLIQPFLENAVWHGVSGGGKIDMVITQADDNHLLCEIKDEKTNSKPVEKEINLSHQVKKTSLGMQLMQERFDLLNQINNNKSGYRLEERKDGIPGKVLQIRIPFED